MIHFLIVFNIILIIFVLISINFLDTKLIFVYISIVGILIDSSDDILIE